MYCSIGHIRPTLFICALSFFLFRFTIRSLNAVLLPHYLPHFLLFFTEFLYLYFAMDIQHRQKFTESSFCRYYFRPFSSMLNLSLTKAVVWSNLVNASSALHDTLSVNVLCSFLIKILMLVNEWIILILLKGHDSEGRMLAQ